MLILEPPQESLTIERLDSFMMHQHIPYTTMFLYKVDHLLVNLL
jgi:hypothetical protein